MVNLKGSVLPDEQFIFSLNSNPTTGFNLVVVSDGGLTYDRWYKSDKNPKHLDGVGGTEFFAVEAHEPGRYVFVVRYERGPDERGSESTLELQVRPNCKSIYASTWANFPLTVPLWNEPGSDWKIVDQDGVDCRIETDEEGRCRLCLKENTPGDRWIILQNSEGYLSVELKVDPVDEKVFLKARAREKTSHSAEANVTTGYRWEVVDGGGLVYNDRYVPDPNPGWLCGVGGNHIFEMFAETPGTYVLRAMYARSWEDYGASPLEIVLEATGQEAPDTIRTSVGKDTEIRLGSDEERGYAWKIVESDGLKFDSEYVPSEGFGPGERIFRTVPIFKGQSKFLAEYVDPKGKAVDRYSAIIEISPETDCIKGETRVRKPYVVEVPSNPTTGYQWSVADNGGLDVKERYEPSSKDRKLCGGGGKTVYELSSDSPGEYTFVAEYSRSWEDSPIKRLVVELKINPARRLFG